MRQASAQIKMETLQTMLEATKFAPEPPRFSSPTVQPLLQPGCPVRRQGWKRYFVCRSLAGTPDWHASRPFALYQSARLKSNSHLRLESSWRYEVRAAKSREEVIQRFLVRQVDSRQPQAHLRVFRAEQVVGSNAGVE